MELTVNTFNKGLQTDSNPMMAGKESLSDCLNGTFITQNGNELVLLNDMGNARVDHAYLPPGYEPVGIKEYGGIIYVASYNPITNKSLIGSFPSPERIKGTENDKLGNNVNLDFCSDNSFTDRNINYLKNDSILYPLSDDLSLHVGDKFAIYYKDNNLSSVNYETFFADVSNYNNVSDGKVNTPKNKLYTLSLGILNSQNEFVDITKSLLRYNTTNGNRLADAGSELLNFNNGYFIRPVTQNGTNIPTINDNNYWNNRLTDEGFNTYAYKLIGPLYLKVQLNHILEFTYNIKGFKETVTEDDTEKTYANLTLTGTLTYNCPDEFVGIPNLPDSPLLHEDDGDDNYNSYELYKIGKVTNKYFKLIKLYLATYNGNDEIIGIDNNPVELEVSIISHSYDKNTNLYKLILECKYKIEINSGHPILDLFLGIDSGINCNSYLENLSEWITIDTNLLGSGQLKLTEYKFFNYDDYSNFQYNLEYYEKDNEQISNMKFIFYNVEDEEDFIESEIVEPVNGRGVVKIPFNNTLKLYRGKLVYTLTNISESKNYVIYDELGILEENDNDGINDTTIFLLTTKLLNPCYNSSNKEEYVRNFKDFVIYSKTESSNPKPELVFKDKTKYIDNPNADNSEFDRRKNAIKEKLTINYEYVTEYDGELVKVGQALKNGSLLVSSFESYDPVPENQTIVDVESGHSDTENTDNSNYIIHGTCNLDNGIFADPEIGYLIDSSRGTDCYKTTIKFDTAGNYEISYKARAKGWDPDLNDYSGGGASGTFDLEIGSYSERFIEVENNDYGEYLLIASSKNQYFKKNEEYPLYIECRGTILIYGLKFCKITLNNNYEVSDVTIGESIRDFRDYSNLITEGMSKDLHGNTYEEPDNQEPIEESSEEPASSITDDDLEPSTSEIINDSNNWFVPQDELLSSILLNDYSTTLTVLYGKTFYQNINPRTYEYTFIDIPIYSVLQIGIYSKRHDGRSTKNNLTIELDVLNNSDLSIYNMQQEILEINTSTTSNYYDIPVTYLIRALPLINEEIYDQLKQSNQFTFNCKIKMTSTWYIRSAALLYNGDIEQLSESVLHNGLANYEYLPYHNSEFTIILGDGNWATDRDSNYTAKIENITGYLQNKYTTFVKDQNPNSNNTEIYIVKTLGHYQFVVGDGMVTDELKDGRISFRRNLIFDVEKFILDCNSITNMCAPNFNTCQKFTIADLCKGEYPFSLLYTKKLLYNYNIKSTYNHRAVLSYFNIGGDLYLPTNTDLIGSTNFYIGLYDSFAVRIPEFTGKTFTAYIGINYVDNQTKKLNTITYFEAPNLNFGQIYSFYDFIQKIKTDDLTELLKLDLSVPACYMNTETTMIFSLDGIRDIKNSDDSVFYSDALTEGVYFNVAVDVYRTPRNSPGNIPVYLAPLRANSNNYIGDSSSSTNVSRSESYDGTAISRSSINEINMTYSLKFKVLDYYNSKLNVVEDYNLYPDYIEESTTNGVKTILTYEVEDFTPLFIKEGETYSIDPNLICTTKLNYITFNQIFKSSAITGDKQIQNGFIRIHDAISSVQSSNEEIANDTTIGISYSNNNNKSFIGNFCRELYDGESGEKLLESEMINTYDTKKHVVAFNISEYEDKLFRDLNLKFTKNGSTYNHEEHSYIFSYCFAKEAVYNGHGKVMYMGNSAGIDELDNSLQLINTARIWWRGSNNSWVLIKAPFRGNGLKYHNQFEFCNYLKYSLFTTNFTYCGLQDITCSLAGIYYPDESDYIYTGRFNPKVSVNLTVKGGELKHLNNNNYPPIRDNYPIKFWTKLPNSNSETLENIKEFTLEYNENFFDEIDNVLNGGDILSIDINTGNMYDYLGESLYPGVIYLINGNNLLVKDIDLTNKLLYSPKYKIGIYNGILCNNVNYTVPTYTYDFCDGEFSSSDYKYPRIDYTSAKTVSL